MRSSVQTIVMALMVLSGAHARAYSEGPPPGHTGAPGETLTCVLCHSSYKQDSGPGVVIIDGPEIYVPGRQYIVALSISQFDRTRFGFQFTSLDERTRPAGTLSVLDPENTQVIADETTGRTYVQHTLAGTYATVPGQLSWTFLWIAPDSNVGEVDFYAAANAADGDGTPAGDYIYRIAAGLVAAEEPR